MKWHEKFPKLGSFEFTNENSGRKLRWPPFSIRKSYLRPGWDILGYTLDPPFKPTYESVAIMFETKDGERVWWHYELDEEA